MDKVEIYKSNQRVMAYINGATFLDELFFFYDKHEILEIINDKLLLYYQDDPREKPYQMIVKQWR